MKNDLFLLTSLLYEEIDKYKNKTVDEIQDKLNLNLKGKNVNNRLFKAIINDSDNIERIDEIISRGKYQFKSVNLEWNNNLKESMSLSAFKYEDIYNETWDNSSLKQYFSESIFIFVIFKKDFSVVYFEGIKFWKMPINILENDVKKVWLHTKSIIEKGTIVNYIDSRGRSISNFMTSRNTKVIHVRPHARNKDDTYDLPIADKETGVSKYTKHSFWINSNFIKRIINDGRYYD